MQCDARQGKGVKPFCGWYIWLDAGEILETGGVKIGEGAPPEKGIVHYACQRVSETNIIHPSKLSHTVHSNLH